MLYNEGYAEVLAGKHPSAMGRDFLDIWAEIRADLQPIVDQAYAGIPVHMADIELLMLRKGYSEETHFSFSYTPMRDEAGAVMGFFCPCIEITQQVLADRRRAADMERQRRLFEQAPGFIAILHGPDHVFEFANATYRRLFGEREFVGRTVRDAFPELENQGFYELLDRVFSTGERFVADHRGQGPARVWSGAGSKSGCDTGIRSRASWAIFVPIGTDCTPSAETGWQRPFPGQPAEGTWVAGSTGWPAFGLISSTARNASWVASHDSACGELSGNA